MLSTSTAYRVAMANGADIYLKATLHLANGTTMQLEDDDFTLGGLTVSEAVSASDSFEVGAAVVGSGTVTLSNYEGKFDEVDFAGATIIPYIGIEMADGTIEWLRRATWNVEQPASYGTTIKLECLDNMSLLDRPFADVSVQFPATVQVVADAICTACGVTFRGGEFPNRGYTFQNRPADDMSCRDALSYIAQAAGCFAKCDTSGRVLLGWYSLPETTEASLDGGSYGTSTTPYSDGDYANGGSFMSGGGSFDGGAFGTAVGPVIADTKSLTVLTDDVVITGVSVTAAAEVEADGTEGDEGETVFTGSEGYVLTISDNPFIEYGRAFEVAQNIGLNTVGMRFRPLQCSAVGDPTYEASDPAVVFGIQGDMHFCWLTRITWKAGGFEEFACDAEPAARNTASGYVAQTGNRPWKRAIRAEKTARELAIAQIQHELATSSGLYVTPVVQQDGSTIYYAHDKPELSESSIVWKMTAEAIGISTDGGQTYPYALDVNGVAILNRIYAIGIDADYVTTGRIQDAQGYNFWDLDTGAFQMAASTLIGGKTAAQIAQGAVDAQTQSDIFNKLTNNGVLQGLYMSGGKLYVNATYIKSGTLTVGGASNGNGIILVKDANGNTIGRIDKDGANIQGELVTKYKYDASPDSYTATFTSEATSSTSISLNTQKRLFDGRRPASQRVVSTRVVTTGGGGVDGPALHLLPFRTYANSPWSGSTQGYYGALAAEDGLSLVSCMKSTGCGLYLGSNSVQLAVGDSNKSAANNVASITKSQIDLGYYDSTSHAVGLYMTGNLSVIGSKSRVAGTEHYADRQLYAYETPAPYFGDIGSATTDENGECVVMVDDVFAETVRMDMGYQVFLQACGQGSVYVEEKSRTHFIVRGTPNLPFDWEVKAHQRDYELTRTECHSLDRSLEREGEYGEGIEDAYSDDYAYLDTIERIQYGDIEAA